ncbi:MAG TPA: LptA/OstA family protein [Candidatus Binataceae bacterium]|nr:LptA/OstA family protein [Candidatus Binataceae bacterium]
MCAAALVLAPIGLVPGRARAQESAPEPPSTDAGPGFASTLPEAGGGLPDVGSVTSAFAADSSATSSPAPPANLGDSVRKPAGAAGADASASAASAAASTPAGAAGSVAGGGAPATGSITQAAATPPAPATAQKGERSPGDRAHPVAAASAPSAGQASSADAKDATAEQGNPFSALQLSSGHGPIDIKSDTLELDYKGNSVTFRGHVRAVQADAVLTSDSLKVLYGKDFHEVKEMFADGNVRMSQGTRWATGDHAVLDQTAHTVVLTGNPVVHDGEDQVAGTRITVHLDSGKSEVQGARAVLFPKQQQTRDNKGAPAAQQL